MTPSSQIPSVQTLHAVQGRLLAALADIPEITQDERVASTLGRMPGSSTAGITISLYCGPRSGQRALEAAAEIIGGTIAPTPHHRPYMDTDGTWWCWHRLLTEQEDVRVEIHAALPISTPDQDETGGAR